MDFNTLSWSAVLFYYRSAGDKKYGTLMADTSFLERLRRNSGTVDPAEFEAKVILDQVHVEDYDLLVGHALARRVLSEIVKLQSILSPLLDMDILDCNLSGTFTTDAINRVYSEIACVDGLWITGGSKIMHVLNDRLFAMLSPDIASSFGLSANEFRLVEWMRFIQENARAVASDFKQRGFQDSPAVFLSEKLGYAKSGYRKSMVKFLDEYFWLRHGDCLPVPPAWLPSLGSSPEAEGTYFACRPAADPASPAMSDLSLGSAGVHMDEGR